MPFIYMIKYKILIIPLVFSNLFPRVVFAQLLWLPEHACWQMLNAYDIQDTKKTAVRKNGNDTVFVGLVDSNIIKTIYFGMCTNLCLCGNCMEICAQFIKLARKLYGFLFEVSRSLFGCCWRVVPKRYSNITWTSISIAWTSSRVRYVKFQLLFPQPFHFQAPTTQKAQLRKRRGTCRFL